MKLPAHKCGLYLEHNAHRDVYEKVEDTVAQMDGDCGHFDWQSDEHRARAIATGEVWTLQWYPDTPTGCFCLAAPTLDELLSFANAEEPCP